MLRSIKILLISGVTGVCAGISFVLVNRVLSQDSQLELWELAVSFLAPAILAVFIAKLTKTNMFILIIIAILTTIIPVLGPAFGGTGKEPVWQFGAMGLIGGLIWSLPFFLWRLFRRK